MSSVATTAGGAAAPATRTRAHARTARPRRGTPQRAGNIVGGIAAWLVGLLFAFPVFWMVLTGFHREVDAATNPPALFAPLTLDGYRSFFGAADPWPYLVNSLTAALGSTLVVILLSLPAAYALSIKPIRGWTDVMFFFLSTKFLPIVAGILPLYLFFQWAGILDNVTALGLLYTSMNVPIAVWMLRSFLAEVPKEILEAASLDGAGLLTTMRRVIVPVIMPGLAATALICFIFAWNELLLARTLTAVIAGTAPVFLTGFVTSQGLFLAQVCAAATAISLPVLVAGFAAQDRLVQGLSFGAVK